MDDEQYGDPPERCLEIRGAIAKKSLYSIRLKVLPRNRDFLRELAKDIITVISLKQIKGKPISVLTL